MTYALFRCLRQGPRQNSRLSSNRLSALNYDDWQTLASQCTKRLFIKRLEYFDYSRTNTKRINLARMKKRKNEPFLLAEIISFIDLITYMYIWPIWWSWKTNIILLSKDAAFLKFTRTRVHHYWKSQGLHRDTAFFYTVPSALWFFIVIENMK